MFLIDLHGLFSFIREDPYYEKKWFNDLLYDPYRSGDRKPMVSSLGKVLWRTTKRFVLDQVPIYYFNLFFQLIINFCVFRLTYLAKRRRFTGSNSRHLNNIYTREYWNTLESHVKITK